MSSGGRNGKQRGQKRPARPVAVAPVAVVEAPPAREFDRQVDAARAKVDALVSVRVARRGVDSAEHELAGKIAAAKRAGSSWAQIGLAVGMTGRGAQKRWGES